MQHFFAYISRLKLIRRWGLMRSTVPENTQEHSYQVAVVAHALAVIKNTMFGGNVDADRVAVIALYHDASEVLTGDLPTPIKYANETIRESYHKIEADAKERLLGYLNPELVPAYREVLSPEDKEADALVHIADKICAYTKCLEEIIAGNAEFTQAKNTIEQQINAYTDRPEVQYYLENYVPSFTLTLDEMK